MNIWKIASRWSDSGTKESSILDIFRRYKVVFAGREQEKIKNKIKTGDLIAISDGVKIVSVAKVIGAPTLITNFDFDEKDKEKFAYEDWVVGFKVDIYNLDKEEIFKYRQGTFHGVGDEVGQKVLKLYESKSSSTSEFSINTYTYTLLGSENCLLQKGLKYIIPVYQRPYSWNDVQIESFINDIFISFWGNDGKSKQDNMFIGTMQLSEKKYSDQNEMYQEIVDGQQRISTLTLFLKLLSQKYPHNEHLQALEFDWIDTDVNRGEQSKYLQEVLIQNQFDSSLNKYAENYLILEKYFNQNIENDDEVCFNINLFVKHLMSSLYFVVIETKAGLSKTLQIFNAINTTGLDLDSTDIFKIRLYEYLSSDKDDKKVFHAIDELYKKIDVNNKILNREVVDMNGVLTIYKHYLMSKYAVNMTLWKMATGTFFERLFDTLLNIKQWEGFNSLKNLDIKIEDINKIIDIRFNWEDKHYGKNTPFEDFNSMLSLRLLWWSRYHRYWIIPFVYSMREDSLDIKFYELLQALSRLYISYSLIYAKQIDEIHKFTNMIAQKILLQEHIDDVIEEIKKKTLSVKKRVSNVVKGEIFWSNSSKNLLPRLCASVDENEKKTPIKDIESLVFVENKIDIEHIQSRNDQDTAIRDEIKAQWGDLLNSIGNLMVLEYSINRSIGNNGFEKKKESYKKSKFTTVKQLATKTIWNKQEAEIRRDQEVEKITDFLYS